VLAATKLIVVTIICSAVYGFAVGSVHSNLYAVRNLIKFPMLIFITCGICSICYYVFSKFITWKLSFVDVQFLALKTFRDISLLLSSLAPACFFLALTTVKPTDGAHMGGYPLFLGMNVAFIAVCGSVTLVYRTLALIKGHGVSVRKGIAVILAWLLISLFAGGQCAWYLRPFYGVAFLKGIPFAMGKQPHVTGATNFYEGVWHIISPPGKNGAEEDTTHR